MKHALPVAMVMLILAGRSSALAHHSHPNFLLDQEVSIEGDLVELKYANPHVLLKIRTADGVVYTAEWQAASWLLSHAHVTLSTLRVLDHVIVSGAPSRDPESHELVQLKEVRRPIDGWTYRVIQNKPVEPSSKR